MMDQIMQLCFTIAWEKRVLHCSDIHNFVKAASSRPPNDDSAVILPEDHATDAAGASGNHHSDLSESNLAAGCRDCRPPIRYAIDVLYHQSLRIEEREADEAFEHAFSVLYDADSISYPR
jgi:hypothetical protein